MTEAQVGGYEFKVNGKIPTTCQCIVCKELIRECTELPCHHPNHVLRCMYCNQEYKVEEKHYSKTVDRIVTEDLEVFCKHHKQGCPWTGAINDFMQHANTDCPCVEITCRFTGCDVHFLRKAKQQHEQDCPMKEMNCDYCHQVIKVSQEQEHYTDCVSYPTVCSNQGCQYLAPRDQLYNSIVIGSLSDQGDLPRYPRNPRIS
ncbi:RING finger protein DG17-like [Clytia hemisphaerica]|uniref:RING finger protein DG17-like n=1 Tax=Clytia hemisphaerica TaxID=252671 RepID=UPI0034D412F5